MPKRSMLWPAKPSRAGSRVTDAADHDGHDDGGAEAHPGDHRDAGDGEAADGDHDGGAGEDHGLPGGGDGPAGGVVDRQAVVRGSARWRVTMNRA